MKDTKLTKKKAIELTLKLWRFLARTGTFDKSDWPKADKYKLHEILNKCFLCEITEMFIRGCEKCPLYEATGRSCVFDNTIFDNWCCASSDKERKKYARQMVKVLESLCK